MNKPLIICFAMGALLAGGEAKQPADVPAALLEQWKGTYSRSERSQNLPELKCDVAVFNRSTKTVEFRWTVSEHDPFTSYSFGYDWNHEKLDAYSKDIKCLKKSSYQTGKYYLEVSDVFAIPQGRHFYLDAKERYAFYSPSGCTGCVDFGHVPSVR